MTTAPDTEHVEVRVNCSIEESLNGVAWLVSLVLEPGIEHICWHVIGSLAVNGISIDFHFELLILQIHLHSPNTEGYLSLINHLISSQCNQLHLEIVNVWLSDAVGPPQLRVGNMKVEV